MDRFRKLGIIEPIIKSIQEQNFESPSEIQIKSIPLIMEGRDVIAGAATGSGKTLVFASAIIKNSERNKEIQALILTPTRELAEQVSTTLQKFSKNKRLEIISVYGGVSINPQINRLRTADVVVGTPGRILDHINRRTIDLDNINILVLDEADRMFDMGFQRDVGKIISRCPSKRQTLLFSATISEEVTWLARKYMHNPVQVSAESYVDPSKITQVYYEVEESEKFSLLFHLLKHEKSGLVMVFCNTKRKTDFVAENLIELGIDASAIHGGYSQERRSKTMRTFSSQDVHILICTDVASRGLDIKGVSHVYNYDISKDSKDYIHRIGRTARAGKDGKVINLVSREDDANFRRIIYNKKHHITKEQIPEMEMVSPRSRYTPHRQQSNYHRSNNRSSSYGSQNQGRFRRRSTKKPFKTKDRFFSRRRH